MYIVIFINIIIRGGKDIIIIIVIIINIYIALFLEITKSAVTMKHSFIVPKT